MYKAQYALCLLLRKVETVGTTTTKQDILSHHYGTITCDDEPIKKEDLEKSLEVFEGTYETINAYKDKYKIVSYTLVEVDEAYIHCSLHIPLLEKVEETRTH